MGTLTKGQTFSVNDSITNTKLHNLVDLATVSDIVNADISASAAIADSKLAQITTAGKVSGQSITALASLPTSAGYIPSANLSAIPNTALSALSMISMVNGNSLFGLANIPSGAGVIPVANIPATGVVQVVNTQTGATANGSTILPYDDTIPQNTEGDQYMTLAITPTSATNKLKIDVVFICSPSIAARNSVALFQDSTASALAAASSYALTAEERTITFSHYMTAGTTSATTFKIRAGVDASGTLTFNGFSSARKLGGVYASSITITEIKV